MKSVRLDAEGRPVMDGQDRYVYDDDDAQAPAPVPEPEPAEPPQEPTS